MARLRYEGKTPRPMDGLCAKTPQALWGASFVHRLEDGPLILPIRACVTSSRLFCPRLTSQLTSPRLAHSDQSLDLRIAKRVQRGKDACWARRPHGAARSFVSHYESCCLFTDVRIVGPGGMR